MSDLKLFKGSAFDHEVLASEVPVLVDFYADWCGPCKAINPIVEEIAVSYASRLSVGKLDVDAEPEIAMRFGVMGMPTLGLFRGGKMVDRLVGYPGPSGVKSWIARAMEVSATAR